MPIPDTPQTRQEQYLNAIATGDASGIPDTPQCRQEQYLDAIARNGGGGGGAGGGGVLVVHDVEGTLDKTWQEIHDADFAVIYFSPATGFTAMVIIGGIAESGYSIYGVAYNGTTPVERLYSASSASGYPVLDE